MVIRRSQRFLGDVPWLLVASFFPMDLARGTALEQAGIIEQGSIKLLADLGHPQQGSGTRSAPGCRTRGNSSFSA